jgi:hypothetical protein
MDYCWETILLPTRRKSQQNRSKYLRASCQIPFTGHLPLSSDGSFIFLWSDPGVGIPYHIPYGKMLIIHGDVVHCGGLPPQASSNNLSSCSLLLSNCINRYTTKGYLFE